MQAWELETTICAIATGTAPAFRGIIRISGPDALATALLLTDPKQRTELAMQLATLKAARRIAASIVLPAIFQRLPAAFFIWPDERSYTGQPTVEIHSFGNLTLLQMVVQRLTEIGVEIAGPGEFTYRAFLNGRLDLTQCEAVLGVIHADNQAALQSSLRQLAGGLSQPLEAIRGRLIELLADLEAGLDFVDEDIEFISREQIRTQLTELQRMLQTTADQLGSRVLSSERPRVVLVGWPNAGKSSLINSLARTEVAIVSEMAGTTRDFVRQMVPMASGTPLDLIDTAGFEEARDTSDSLAIAEIRQLAQRQLREQIAVADLVLICAEAGEERDFGWLDESIATARSTLECWLVQTKSDRSKKSDAPDLNLKSTVRSLKTSVVDTGGTDELRAALQDWIVTRHSNDADVQPLTLVRCSASIQAANEALMSALEVSNADTATGNELIAAELRSALHELGSVVGEVYTDDILDALFSRFCIGK